MKNCAKCGAVLNDDAVFCANCGADVSVKDESNNRGMARFFSIIAYFSPFWLIGLLVGPYKRNPIVRRHVGQGIILAIAEAILSVVGGIITGFISIVFSVFAAMAEEPMISMLGSLISFPISMAIGVVGVVFTIIGVINAAKLQEKNLPLIGKLAFYK